jgi:hypothetical protein
VSNLSRLSQSIQRAKRGVVKIAKKNTPLTGVVSVFAALGILMAIVSQAAGPFIALEAENGSATGAVSALSDNTASGGGALKFGLASAWPTTPPAQICGNASILGAGPTTAPVGAITVPAGDNSNLTPNWLTNGFSTPNKTFWFAPGVHRLGNDEFAQILPGDNSTFIGAPGAIIDGQGLNQSPMAGGAQNVRVAYLEIKNFIAQKLHRAA